MEPSRCAELQRYRLRVSLHPELDLVYSSRVRVGRGFVLGNAHGLHGPHDIELDDSGGLLLG